MLQSPPVRRALSPRLKSPTLDEGELRTSPGVPSNFDDGDTASLQSFDFTIHIFHWLFDEAEFIINVYFI
ncbi:hypothetical protein Tco_0653968 [Tanacetum coccineum]|uniref:Uncharacterized protein n=1 Tax=Tanacetum coccineum TaxID=301880 RepID=A0ABQ4X217_9ASTR